MSHHRKRKWVNRGDELNLVTQKVLGMYGQDKMDGEGSTPAEEFPKGRKQKRRERKLLNKKRRQINFQKKSKKCIVEESQPAPKIHSDVNKQRTKQTKQSKQAKQAKMLLDENTREDKAISALEKKLFMSKRKSKKLPKSFLDAGLDYVLDVIGNAGSESDEDEAIVDDFFSHKKTSGKHLDANLSDADDGSDSGADDVVSADGDEDDFTSMNPNYVDSEVEEGEANGEEEDANYDSKKHLNLDEERKIELTSKDDVVHTAGKYIPPALRAKLSDKEQEERRNLKRKLKGFYNKLSDSNLNNISNDIESMYRTHSRAVMNSVLTEIIMEQFTAPDPVPEALIMQTAMLVTVLSVRVAIEVLMHFYEVTSLKLHSVLIPKADGECQHGKAPNNLLQLLGCLYQLKTIDCGVIIDFFNLLVTSFAEKDVELILEILNRVGFQLRKDKPELLRDVIRNVSTKCEELGFEANDGSRMSYMLNILMAVKNNNIRKVIGYDPEVIVARRKRVAALIKTSKDDAGSSESLPSITLKDFLNVESSGRWWIVGSSFMGRPMLRNRDDDSEERKDDEEIDHSVSKKIVEAARKQRMNTDVRRKIFYAVMTADDFVDAFEKIIKCGLKGKQLREIANVVVDCCQQETKFNPYYLHLLNRFCQYDRQFVISLQCTAWDKFKVLQSLKQTQTNNLVHLLSHLTIMDAIPLSFLKAIDFSEMDQTLVRFLRSYLCTLAELSADNDRLAATFDRLAASSKCKTVRQGLNLFLRHFVLSDDDFRTSHPAQRDAFTVMLNSVGRTNKTFL